ncbi:penicillin-binding transpeptidase domain-containing protein [Paenarthrobacter ilicis]|uniref:Cell division protein FtsI/penicillin-binding protein 2 n=1 Tax=Paenarthrobacter ilicis TaxID=43665 RepID=A0ABX0TJF2_9MICC|nr:penicillin-binding transpeptidase domain-containing protein [Paenarthrobacter ilicis]MBM7791415.1 cell division protein FtsI/penicillin-binding protein 2 [Paenarthrobacter ilicis]NIJ02684.1 cell division protein FtsI/penicillin-binding protein 2 [Paenarthrobacter ilicis]
MGKFTPHHFVLGLAAVVMAGSLTACDDGRSGAESAAKQLASSLSTLDVGSLAVAGKDAAAANEELKAVFEGLDAKPSVQSGDVKLDGDTATFPLNYSWNIGSAKWEYAADATLKKDGDKWAVQWSPALLAPQLADGEKLTAKTIPAQRGQILGAGDAPIVQDRPVFKVGIDKTKVPAEQADASARAMAALLGLDAEEYAKQVAASGAQAFVEGLVLRAYTADITEAKIQAIPGGSSILDSMALAPTRTFARPVLGSVGQASAEQIEKSNGALRAGDTTGTGGLQQKYDSLLRGKDGVEVVASSAAKDPGETQGTRELFSSPPAPGTTLKTTLDLKLQQLAEETLAQVGPASAIVAVKPSTGAVLAAASGPGSNGYNTAMLGQYAPGSTFKMVDSLAMFRNGATPDSKVECTPTLTVDGRTFKNAEGYPAGSLGSVALRDAFAHSCNTAFINARDTVSQSQLESAAQALGVAVEAPKLGADAFLGSVPGAAEGTEHAASMIGQGKVLFSPLSAAVMAASVANGAPVSPQLVLNADAAQNPGASATPTESGTATPSSDTATASALPASPASTQPITKEEAASLADMMRAVVTSGHAGFLAQVPGAPVGAKTGTAEFGNDDPPKTHAWIVATHGDLAVAVFVEDGGLGATTSGPLLKSFLTAAG